MTNSTIRHYGSLCLRALWTTAAGAQTPSTPRRQLRVRASDACGPIATTTVNGDTGLWYVPDRRGTRERQMVRERLPRRHELPRGIHQRRRLSRHVRLSASRDRRGNLRFVQGRHPHRSRHPAALHQRPQGRRRRRRGIRWSDRDGAATNSATSLVGAKFNLMSEADQKRGGGGRPRHDQAADGDRRTTAPARARPTDCSTSLPARKPRSGWKCPVTPASGFRGIAGQGLTVERIPLRHRRGVPVAQPVAGHRRVQRREAVRRHHDAVRRARRALTAALAPLTLGADGLQRRDARAHVAGQQRVLHRRRRDLVYADGGSIAVQDRRGPVGRLRRLSVPDRLSPRRAQCMCAPPPPAPAPPPPAAPQNRPPTVQARCEPCTIEVGKTVTVTAVAQDPDGDALTYRWTAPGGTLQNPTRPPDDLDRAAAGRPRPGRP